MMRRTSLLAVTTYGFGHPDMTKEFSPVTTKSDSTAKVEAAKVTKMPNGARVISHDRDGAQTSVGFYLKAGAKYDPSNRPGLNMVLRFALCNSNMESTLFQINKTQRGTGVSHSHNEIRKEWLSWKNEGRRDVWQKPFEDMASCVVAPRFAEWDTEKFRDTMDTLQEEKRWNLPREYAVDQLTNWAFWKQPLGSPAYVPAYANDMCNHKALLDQWAHLCVPRNIVVAGVNVDHEELVAAYQNAPFPHSADAPHHAASQPLVPTLAEPNQYSAREHHEIEDREKAKGGSHEGIDQAIISAIGYPVAAGTSQPNPHANVLVLNELLAMSLNESIATATGDQSFEGHIRGHQSFGRSFAGVSLIGITAQSNIAGATRDIIESNKVLTKGISVTPENVKIAQVRAATKFYHNNIEYQRDYLDFLGTSLVADSTNVVSPTDMLKAIESTTAASINTLYKGALESKPTFFATGPVTGLSSLRQMGI